jgi:hypothetical protein
VLSDQLIRWCCVDRLSRQRLSGLSRDKVQNVGDVPPWNVGNVDPVNRVDFSYESIVRQIGMKIPKTRFVRNECPREFENAMYKILLEVRVLINAFPIGEVRHFVPMNLKECESYDCIGAEPTFDPSDCFKDIKSLPRASKSGGGA